MRATPGECRPPFPTTASIGASSPTSSRRRSSAPGTCGVRSRCRRATSSARRWSSCATSPEPIPASDSEPGGDLLLCTHGARDVCCGGPGHGSVEGPHRAHPGAARPTSPSVAPATPGDTGSLPRPSCCPSGTVWAWLDPTVIHAVTHRSGPIDDVLPHYRGSCLLSGIAEQVVDLRGAAPRRLGVARHTTPRHLEPTDVQGETVVELRYATPTVPPATGEPARRSPAGRRCRSAGSRSTMRRSPPPVIEIVGDVVHAPG